MPAESQNMPAQAGEPTLAQKVTFLRSPEAYPDHPRAVEVKETHMSWVFLTGAHVYKLKKPLRRPFLDFSTLARRKRNCEMEVRLNRRLAPEVYLGMVPLRVDLAGRLSLGGPGEIVDWLVQMKQLPAVDMLDERIRTGKVSEAAIIALGSRLAAFYQAAEPVVAEGQAYLCHLAVESQVNREILLLPEFGLDPAAAAGILDRTDRVLQRAIPAIAERIARGWIVEGHGDLRPEHVSLAGAPKIIDCLEFDRRMRILDPYDEINYLGLECELLGAAWIRPLLLSVLRERLGHSPDPALIAAYGAFRSSLRARICIAHLIDGAAVEPSQWQVKASRYLALADRECLKAAD